MALHIATIVGARPQFIKAAALSRVLRADARFRETLIHTGQHYDDELSDIFFRELDIPRPEHHLGIGSAAHGAQTGRMLAAIEQVLLAARPDRVIVFGDTNSTLAGALAAVKLHIPVAHVEAGLRSFKRRMPEEINRVLTDHAADLLFAPTQAAVENLAREGIVELRVRLAGDVMYDAALHYGAKAEERSDILERLGLERGRFILATIHRAENTDDSPRLGAICGGLAAVAEALPVVWPVHPRTRAAMRSEFDRRPPGLRLIEPVGYLDMIALERGAALIATDSGGVQKEAFFHRVPCLTLRDETEWVELVELGCNRLCPPTSAATVAAAIRGWLDAGPASAGFDARPYGNGDAARRIAEGLLSAAL